MRLLEIEDLTKHFGGVKAIDHLSFHVNEHEILATIGPNGAGKTTLFNVITKVFPPTDGRVLLRGNDITKLKAHQVAEVGIARTFQNIRLLKDMTALENVMSGCHHLMKTGMVGSLLLSPRARKEERRVKEMSLESLAFVGLEKDAYRRAGDLPYGTEKLLELARALVSNPDLILLDEPVAGLNDVEREHMAELVCKLREMGKTCIIVEHQMEFVRACSDRVVVLNYGNKIAEGTMAEVQANPEVITAYLGDARGV
jgi:branched-chain amino acid transport system ATP-binding protein